MICYLLCYYYYVIICCCLFFCRAQIIFSILTKFLQVSGRSNLKMSLVPMILFQKRTWRIQFNLSWAPLVTMVLSIKGAQAYMIQFNMTLSMDPVAIPGSNSWPQDFRAPLWRLLMIYYYDLLALKWGTVWRYGVTMYNYSDFNLIVTPQNRGYNKVTQSSFLILFCRPRLQIWLPFHDQWSEYQK